MPHPESMRTIRTSVPPAVFAALEDRAAQRGMTLAALARERLVSLVLDEPAQPEQQAEDRTIPATPGNEWSHLVAWLREHSTLWATYDGPRNVNRNTDRQAIMTWARENGYEA